MKRGKKILALTVLMMLIISVVGLTGCSVKPAADASKQEQQSAQTTQNKQEEKPITITLWNAPDFKGIYDPNAQGADYGDLYKFAAEEFKKEHGNVTIEVENVPGADRDAKFSVALQSGTQPDIYIGAAFVVYDYAHNGFLVPLNDIVSEEDKVDIPPKIWAQVTSNGDIYSFPFYTETGHLAINLSLFEQAGVALPIETNPGEIIEWTPEEFRDTLRAIKGKLDGVYPFGFYCGSTQGDTYNVMLLEMFGATLFNDSGSEVAINGPEGVRALEFIKSMYDEGLFAPGAESLNVLDAYQLFLNKQTAVSIYNNVNYDLVNQQLKDGTMEEPFEIQMAFLPSTGDPMCYAYPMGSVVFKAGNGNEKQTEMAKQFVKFYSHAPYSDAGLSMMPLRKSVAQKLDDPLKVKIAESAEYAADFSQRAPGYLKLRASLFPELQACVTGEKTPQEALDSYAKNANAILKDGVENSVLIH
jgi:multiple sugar transport system substrate-binding protein